jgi:hypothetical protein
MRSWPYRLWGRWLPELREQALLRACNIVLESRLSIACLVSLFAAAALVFWVVRSIGPLPAWQGLGLMIITLVPLGMVWLRALLSRVQKELRLQLALKGTPICANCAYELRGLTDPRCPECGGRFEPHMTDGAAHKADQE